MSRGPRRLWLAALLPLFVFALWPSQVRAQDRDCLLSLSDDGKDVGCIQRLSTRRLVFFRRNVQETDRAVVLRATDPPREMPVSLNLPVQTLDYVHLRKAVLIDLHLKLNENESRAVVAPLNRLGAYRITADSIPRFVASQAEILLEQYAGRTSVQIYDILTEAFGTTVFFQADTTRPEAYVFLREGHISFPQFGLDVEGTDSLFVLRPGQIPQPVVLAPAALKRWQKKVDHFGVNVWNAGARPLLLRRNFWLLAGGLGGLAVGAAILTRSSSTTGPGVLDVVVNIPD